MPYAKMEEFLQKALSISTAYTIEGFLGLGHHQGQVQALLWLQTRCICPQQPPRRVKRSCSMIDRYLHHMKVGSGEEGFEPSTCGFGDHCSTIGTILPTKNWLFTSQLVEPKLSVASHVQVRTRVLATVTSMFLFAFTFEELLPPIRQASLASDD
eukprot:Gb_11629 [translate_table: standard]